MFLKGGSFAITSHTGEVARLRACWSGSVLGAQSMSWYKGCSVSFCLCARRARRGYWICPTDRQTVVMASFKIYVNWVE